MDSSAEQSVQALPADSTRSKPLLRPTLTRLMTQAEFNVTEQTIQAYIAEVPSKYTKAAIDAVTPLLPEKSKALKFLFYLRRVCLPDDLPESLKGRLSPSATTPPLLPPTKRGCRGGRSKCNQKGPEDPPKSRNLKLLWLLLCPASVVEHDVLVNALHTAFAIYPEVPKPRIAVIPVPEFAPLSADVAKRWSAQYWPTTYKNANPYGPNPLEVARVEEELYQGNSVHHWMHLAKRVAEEGRTNGLGEPIGAVVVERSEEYGVRVVAVATDARRCGMPHNTDENAGNIMGHAVMRAIGLVAQKRRIVDGKAGTQSPGILSEYGSPPWSTRQQSPNGRRNQRSSDESVESHHSFSSEVICSPSGPLPPLSSNTNNPFLDEPMTFLESHYFAPATLQPRGYLCLQLEMYTTHEPCVMCTMALLHSRFGRVVFAQEMAQTGGLVVDRKDPSVNAKEYLRYGLFWRQELNWKFFCWQYSNGNKNTSGQEYGDDLEAQLTNLSLAPQESFEVALLDAKMHA